MPNQAETCGMWRVTDASLFATTLFLLPNFFQKEILKIEIELFFRVSSTRSEKIARFLSLVFHM
jgi:hypothetical protein